ncbi:hypothetical protein PBY51_019955 [Eleginops maclovinus]|uniref:Fibroblast growth factor-binding protein 1 n=1 Tax=Eleginops maclovinus TaxID=56733 RepID=A0AAN8ASL2_ELEMC|nr:hypothetical protein PBY51_019955 [Eleginops maclovinus]
MLLLKTFAPWLLLAFLGQQVSLSSGARKKHDGADKTVTAAPNKAPGSRDKSAANGRGRMSINNKMQCSWRAKDAGDAVKLLVKCEDPESLSTGGVSDITCEYNGRAQNCPGYKNNNKVFWKQVARAFKKMKGKVCLDESVLVRAAICKRAPRDAHFKLDLKSKVTVSSNGEPETHVLPPPQPRTTVAAPGTPTACTVRANNRKTAEENCSGAWASVCNFFLTMLQSEDC